VDVGRPQSPTLADGPVAGDEAVLEGVEDVVGPDAAAVVGLVVADLAVAHGDPRRRVDQEDAAAELGHVVGDDAVLEEDLALAAAPHAAALDGFVAGDDAVADGGAGEVDDEAAAGVVLVGAVRGAGGVAAGDGEAVKGEAHGGRLSRQPQHRAVTLSIDDRGLGTVRGSQCDADLAAIYLHEPLLGATGALVGPGVATGTDEYDVPPRGGRVDRLVDGR